MTRYNATYYFNANEFPATVTLEKNRLCIGFEDRNQTQVVYWYYDQAQRSKHAAATFEYPGYPLQTLVVLEPELAGTIQAYCERSRQKVVHSRLRPVIKLFTAVVLLLMLSYIVIVPWLAGELANSFPVTKEKAIGKQLFGSVRNSFQIDEKRTAYINAFFDELHIPSRYTVQITVAKSTITNAFALPGGNIVVHDTLLKALNSYEELAALLAHEFAHIENRHTLRSLFRRMGSYLFLMLLIGDVGSVGAVLINNTENLKNLSYSRSLEKEADTYGVTLLSERGINCGGFVQLFRTLKKQTGAQEPPEIINSHPNLEKRIRYIQQLKMCTQQTTLPHSQLQALFLKIKTAE